ncbi:family 5 glycoside hydrolase [Melampsora larici-populina 98AG31]|uniref:Family 5 glycoside hydrolase n=1 Tax=Melampsora larici-populina (strain 98AG31 / pathotype 3-4-7) TaxID=747676 RepID=F4R3I4_MELLP|nr:family 5 glycoside hydrolase [Melampsora larici-populina 98AG31]EGG13163.1 family 5 glycoside hydrolase [Melampsora larici-populina 98AG31]
MLGLIPANFTPLVSLTNNTLMTTSMDLMSQTTGPVVSGVPVLMDTGVVDSSNTSTKSCGPTTPFYHTKTPLIAVLPPFDHDLAVIYRHRRQRSVNLGGWFVHESWMTPSLFRCAKEPKTAELDLASGWGGIRQARSVLEHHWDTFITEKDFAYLQSIGINTVRIPIGYWMLGPEFCAGTAFDSVAGVYINAWSQITNAINMAASHGIGVLIDLHGAPGSQNGKASSGTSDGTSFMDTAATKNVLTFLSERLTQVSNVIGIGLLNEPTPSASMDEFYDDLLAALRELCPLAAEFPYYIQDGYALTSTAQYMESRVDWLILDHHSYFTYDGGSSSANTVSNTSPSQVPATPLTMIQDASEMLHNNMIIGEFSCLISKAKLIQYSNPLAPEKKMCYQQLEAYASMTNGYHFWSYTGESCDKGNWCFKSEVGNILPPDFMVYNGQRINQETTTAELRSSISQLVAPSTRKGVTSSLPPLSLSRRTISRKRRQISELSSSPALPEDPKYINITESSGSLLQDSYSDGFAVAKLFAQENFSELGFVDHYISERIKLIRSGSILPQMGKFLARDQDAADYSVWFLRGLRDGEKLITMAIQEIPTKGMEKRRMTRNLRRILNAPS